jgi:hypothetical protein
VANPANEAEDTKNKKAGAPLQRMYGIRKNVIIVGYLWLPLGSRRASFGINWWGKVVAVSSLILNQIGLILTELC